MEEKKHKLVICWLRVGACGEKMTSGLKMLACGLGQHFKNLGHSI